MRVRVHTIAARLLWLLPWAIAAALAQTLADINDAAVRMQFAFYTADARALRQVVRELDTAELPPDLQSFRDYYEAYGYWKLAELANDKGARARAVRECEA